MQQGPYIIKVHILLIGIIWNWTNSNSRNINNKTTNVNNRFIGGVWILTYVRNNSLSRATQTKSRLESVRSKKYS